jgi:exodeoxyribonuclease VIII
MLDIETLGTSPGSVILSIGAVTFGRDGVGTDTFNKVINKKTCLNAGLTVDEDTLEWWMGQSTEARWVLDEAEDKKSMGIAEVLMHFSIWLANVSNNGHDQLHVWGNGAAFDNALIAEAARRCGFKPLWNYYHDRCYRTLKNLMPTIKLIRTGTHHDALDDARTQAEHAVRLLNELYDVD